MQCVLDFLVDSHRLRLCAAEDVCCPVLFSENIEISLPKGDFIRFRFQNPIVIHFQLNFDSSLNREFNFFLNHEFFVQQLETSERTAVIEIVSDRVFSTLRFDFKMFTTRVVFPLGVFLSNVKILSLDAKRILDQIKSNL